MTRYRIDVETASGWTVQHIVKADTLDEAKARALRAHPGGKVVRAERAARMSEAAQ